MVFIDGIHSIQHGIISSQLEDVCK